MTPAKCLLGQLPKTVTVRLCKLSFVLLMLPTVVRTMRAQHIGPHFSTFRAEKMAPLPDVTCSNSVCPELGSPLLTP